MVTRSESEREMEDLIMHPDTVPDWIDAERVLSMLPALWDIVYLTEKFSPDQVAKFGDHVDRAKRAVKTLERYCEEIGLLEHVRDLHANHGVTVRGMIDRTFAPRPGPSPRPSYNITWKGWH